MIRQITSVATRYPGRVLFGLAIALPLLAIVGGGVTDRLSVGGFVDPDAESTVVADALDDHFGAGAYGFVLLLEPHDKWIYSDINVPEGERLTRALEADPDIVEVASFYNVPEPPLPALSPLRDSQGNRALIALKLAGDDDQQRDIAARLSQTYVRENDIFAISATGSVEVSRVAAELAEQDLQRAELLAAPFTLLGLLLVFRGVRAAVLPLVVAIFAVLGSLVALAVVVLFADVSVFARTLVTALGLGLAVDYSLLLVARFREERARGLSTEAAVERTMQTAGRTVVFSAATVGSSLLGLLVFPVVYLRSFAFAGVAVVSCAALASVLVVPPALIRWGSRMGSAPSSDETFWGRQASRVMKHPIRWLVPVVALLLLLAAPFLNLDAGRVDDRVLPADTGARSAAQAIRDEMSWADVNPIHILAPAIDADDTEAVRAFSDHLLENDSVVRVDSVLGFLRSDLATPPNWLSDHFRPNDAAPDRGTWFSVLYWHDPDDERVDQLVSTLRADLSEGQTGAVLIGGNHATISDTVASVTSRLPLALAIIATVTFVLLFLMTGSLVVPVKAIVLNTLSLSATFGALVWIFQDGNLAGLSGVTSTGRLDVFTPILMFCVAFGLSMDYEVFLLARIKEEYDRTGDNNQAIRVGIGRTGPVVTAAAVLLAIVFLSIATSRVSIVRMFGFGLVVAVLADAFLVRGTVTPALMKIAGKFNWWAPRSLRRFHLRWGIWEHEQFDLKRTSLVGLNGDGQVAADKKTLAAQLESVPLFEQCNSRELRAIARHVHAMSFESGEVVVDLRRSDRSFVVLEGELHIVDEGAVVESLGPGACFGRSDDPAMAGSVVVATTHVECGALSRRMFNVVKRDLADPLDVSDAGGTDTVRESSRV